jgi:DNA polymerase-3 subunit gamma/tau
LALYRRYRPETFAEVIGQEHVTEPLRHALANNKVHHAYLFSGPRGCGKTTSARILARTLNCEQAPRADPCGECQSCRDLARGGPGSIDVIEIDAASHGGVDDARDLRERAFFAPVNSRYKVYIIDEAHMVSSQGFNALLKLVEEPPPHLKFIFATTEPEKVIGTIRSRTHHYPFRLVPPKALGEYLLTLCAAEGVALEPTALPLVVRAGGGSVRDTLSVLDQLLSGAGPGGVGYDLAVRLLGYTPDALLDEAVDAFAARDGATVFSVVDRVVESGQDPRRFAEDLLSRLRDLVVLTAVPTAAETGLIASPGDRIDHLRAQAAGFGPAELVRTADLVDAALTEFRGATAPRLLLELMCARILVPSPSSATVVARLDRLEKRLAMDTGAPPPPLDPGPAPADRSGDIAVAPAAEMSPASSEVEVEAEPPAQPAPVPVSEPEPEPASGPAAAGSLGIADVRRLWPTVLDKVQESSRFAWVMLRQNAQVIGLDRDTLTLALVNAGARASFHSSKVEEHLRAALVDVLGVDWRIETVVDPSAESASDNAVTRARGGSSVPPTAPEDSHVDPARDPSVPKSGLDVEQLLSQELGAQVIGDADA